MSRKGENIYKRQDGRWEGRYIRERDSDGKARYGYVYARSYREVKAKLQEKAAETQVPVASSTEEVVTIPSFQRIAEEWLQSLGPALKESSGNKYHNILTSYITPVLGGLPVNEITREIIESQCKELLQHGGVRNQGLSEKTVSDVISVVRRVVGFASEKGIVTPLDVSTIRIRQHPQKMRVLSRGEQSRLCCYLQENLDLYGVGILVCLFTGIRIGELCALQWEDISIPDRTMHICRTMQRIQTRSSSGPRTKVCVTSPKSACSNRIIPIPDQLLKIILSYRKGATVETGYFLSKEGLYHVEPRTMQNHFKRILRESGVPPANFHTLRHTFATRCVELGFDIKSLSEILGHASVNITMDRYVHPSMELKQQNMQRLSSLFAVI